MWMAFASAVKYEVALADGTVVAKTPEEGFEFHVKDGNINQWDILVFNCLHGLSLIS